MKKNSFCGAMALVMLNACGGGNDSGSSSTLSISGTAATGLAIAGASVHAKCQTGSGSATTLVNGTFVLPVTAGKMPCLLRVTNPLDGSLLHSLASGSGNVAIANITPLTEMLSARVLRQQPSLFFDSFDSIKTENLITPTTISAAHTDLADVLNSTVNTSLLSNFISTPLKAATTSDLGAGDAQDKLLDTLKTKLTTAQLSQVVAELSKTTTASEVKQFISKISAAPPTAHAGTEQQVLTGALVTLDGSKSSDINGDTLTYDWSLTTKPSGSLASLDSSSSAKPSFTADLPGTYVASLLVNDGKLSSAITTVNIDAAVARLTSSTPLSYRKIASFNVVGNNLDRGISVSESGCQGAALTGVIRNTSASVTCTPSKEGTISLTITATATGAILRTESFTVPKPRVKMTTSLGSFLIELEPSKAPLTVNNFLTYVSEGFYTNTVFHRIMSNFMGQSGGFTFAGYKTPTHSPIVLERTTLTGLSNTTNTIAMARTNEANSATSQFFINFKDNLGLNAQSSSDGNGYAVFGSIISDNTINSDTTLSALKAVTVKDNGSGEISLPNNPPVISSAEQVQ